MSGHVVLGVSGGIAAYKAAEVLRGFQKEGFEVRACMTENAARFVGPLTFATLSGHPVSVGRLTGQEDAGMAHVEVTRGAALFVVAPATANVLAKLAAGIADDWLTTHALANEAPLLLAPAMNTRMWHHPSVVDNLAVLTRRGAVVVPPGEGDLACKEVGAGRLAEPSEIVRLGLSLLRRGRDLSGRRVLVTSGPTHERIDNVRFVGNRSSGRMGHALAEAAAARGATVLLVTGPVSLADPAGCEVIRVTSAAEMADAVAARLPQADLAFFAAAVADFAPEPVPGKIARDGRDGLDLRLSRTRDVLAESVASRGRALLVGFAAEVGDDWAERAEAKHSRKACDLTVANRVDGVASAFDAGENEVIVMGFGDDLRLPRASKRVIADGILDRAVAALAARSSP